MTSPIKYLLPLAIVILPGSCKKQDNPDNTCAVHQPTLRKITEAKATVFQSGEKFVMVEQNTIDTRLAPCNLPAEFRLDQLQVIISGDVKATVQAHFGPCCTETFIITKITRAP